MKSYVHNFKEGTKFDISSIGGKGANLIELSRIKGIKVPEGFCVTTEAYKKAFENKVELNSLLDQLSLLKKNETVKIRTISDQIHGVIEDTIIPQDITEAITAELRIDGENHSYAVRSSATAEDLPTASFAGQHDSYLNIIGKDSILKHISKCWASLYTERAVTYRIQNNFDHRKVFLAVVIQRMVIPKSSGIMFTADPVTSNRKVTSIDASYGLGEALVSGLVNPDIYKVRERAIISKNIATKNIAIYALADGGTEERKIESDLINRQTLADEQILRLEQMGRQIEAYFSYPQDIEWCLRENELYIVQSRPITTLYPIPKVTDGENRVFLSSGHMQMMTDPIKPLGMYFFHYVTGNHPSSEVGGRLFIDVTHDLASPIGRKIAVSFLGMIGDKLISNAVSKLIMLKQFIKSLPRGKNKVFSVSKDDISFAPLIHALRIYRKNDPDIIKKFMDNNEKAIRKLQEGIAGLSGDELFAFILKEHSRWREYIVYPESAGALAVAVLSTNWFDKKMEKWLGEKSAADTIIQSVPNSITSDTGLALLDVADVVRQYPTVLDYFDHAEDETFFEDLAGIEGGDAVCNSIRDYLEKYGMRCSGDIDITKPRWSEQPTLLIPMILSNIKNFKPDSRNVKHEQGRLESEQNIQDLANRLKKLPGGKRKAEKAKRIAGIIRNYIGYREYPKFAYIKRYYIYKQALLKEAAKLLSKGIIEEIEDVYYLHIDEFRNVVNTGRLDYSIIESRKEDYKGYEKLTPPRVMTSEGEIITGEYDTADMPEDALPGIAVSSGIIEGRAKVVSSFEDAELEDGDILVTQFTDPSWTPLFVSIKGLVTEVGGLMTHGAVIAREYGLPAVVSVENATQLIKDGQMIRINGTEGYIEILS